MTHHDPPPGTQSSPGSTARPLGEIAGEIGHDLNNLVGVISGRSELVLLQLDRGRSAEARRGVEILRKQLPRLQVLAERLRGLRRPAQEHGAVDVRALVDQVAQETADAGAACLRIESEEKALLVAADSELFVEAMHGILRVAQESSVTPGQGAAQGGGASPPVSLVLRSAQESVELELTVPDSGEALTLRLLAEAARILAPTRAVVHGDLVPERCSIVLRLPAASAGAAVLDPTGASG